LGLSRRRFCSAALTLIVTLPLVNFGSCAKGPSDMLRALRNILSKLEAALSSLGTMSGLPANVISAAAAYLAAAAKFVDDTAHLLESSVLDAAAKAKQILAWASAIIPPQVQSSPTVQAALATVQAAIDGFLRFWQLTPVPAYNLTAGDQALLKTIVTESETDSGMVKAWQTKAAAPHPSSARKPYPTPPHLWRL
jgi:hypothetical protein